MAAAAGGGGVALGSRFDDDTAVEPLGGGRFGARIDPGWFIAAGPNGGYVAAIVLRALARAADDADRAPRSLTLHYTAPPAEGPAVVETRVERRGRSLTTVSGRLLQGDRTLALALAAFSLPRDGFCFEHGQRPQVKAPEECPRGGPPAEIPMRGRYEMRWALGAPPFSGGNEALCGGWIRLAEGPRAVDAPLAAAFTDALPPAVFSLVRPGQFFRGVPTIDLTVHLRTALPLPGAADDEFTLALFRSRVARDGFVEEDGELWSRDGVLLVQSRQLALVA